MHPHHVTWLSIIVCTLQISSSTALNASALKCPCGYYDPSTQNVFTEFTIVYFNETATLPIPGFVEETYTHLWEKGWNSLFREGADPSNLGISNANGPYVSNANGSVSDLSSPTISPNASRSLEMFVQPYRADHLVVGSSLRTERRDIKFGTFTSLMRSPGRGTGSGGSALSMTIEFNLTQMLTVDLQNTNDPSNARVSVLSNEDFPTDHMIPYNNMTNGTFGNGTISPWEYTEFRIDWTAEEVRWYIGGHLARSIMRDDDAALLQVPSPVSLRHWSNGNYYGPQGPPQNTTVANVAWTRMFFNSSLMTEEGHAQFDERCDVADACIVSDMTLRGFSTYTNDSTSVWEQARTVRPKNAFAIWIAVGCIALSSFLLLHPIVKRLRERYQRSASKAHRPETETPTIVSNLFDSRAATLGNSTPLNDTRALSEARSLETVTLNDTRPNSKATTPLTRTRAPSLSEKYEGSKAASHKSEEMPPNAGEIVRQSYLSYIERTAFEETSNAGLPKGAISTQTSRRPSIDGDTIRKIPVAHDRASSKHTSYDTDDIAGAKTSSRSSNYLQTDILDTSMKAGLSTTDLMCRAITAPAWRHPEMSEQSLPRKIIDPQLVDVPIKEIRASDALTRIERLTNLPSGSETQRVDYLAGLITFSVLLITAQYFCLTYVFDAINAAGQTRYYSSLIARKTINEYFLNPIWIGPLLITSPRFLVANYLRDGHLLLISEKTVGRVCRLMIPVTLIAAIEYFLVNCGATRWLEFLPSVSWSSYPFVVGFNSFANFISEVLELFYLIPNAAPTITVNFCSGVLWLMPILLQNSWTTFLLAIVIREIKTPWKRAAFYAFCIVNHWYALSWGSYFYLGVLLTDLDVTYKWRPYLYARPLAYYPLIIAFALLAFGSLGIDCVSQWTGIIYETEEYGIHPDPNSALPYARSNLALYPDYFIPRLNGITFAFGIQALVELSPLLQRVFSIRILAKWIFPHVFTIYLFHGFVFWSLGAWLCVTLSVHGFPYWLNLLLVALVCYTTLALCVPLLTLMVESVARTLTTDLWILAREEPPPRRATLYPFRPDLFLGRYETGQGKIEVETGDAVIPALKPPEPLEKVLEEKEREKVPEETEMRIGDGRGRGKGKGTRDQTDSEERFATPVVEHGKEAEGAR